MIFLFYVLLYKRIKQYIIHLQTSLLERKSQYFSKLQDCINYIKFIKLYSYNTFLSSSLNEKYSQMYTCMLKNQKYTYLLSTSEQMVLLFSQLFLYVVCGYRVIKGSLTIGIFMIMSSYFNYVVNSIKYFSSLYQQYLSAFAGYKRLIEIQQIKDDYQGDKKLGDINLIQIRNVSFAFKEGCIENKCIIRGLNIDFIKGNVCNGVQREHNKKLNNGLPILHKVPPKRDYGRYFCIMAKKGGTSHWGLTEKLSPFFHAKKQEVNAYGR